MRRISYSASILLLLLALPNLLFAAEDTLTLGDGVSVRVLWFEPENLTSPPPLAILLTGGSNNEFMARAQFWLGKELVDRGWALAVPISDQGRKFFVDNSSLMLTVVEQLRELHAVDQKKALLVGISSGGSAALAIAAKAPEHYLGVIATPGRIWDETRFSAMEGLPIYLRIGEKDDFRWHRKLESNAALLQAAGAKVDAALVPNATHIFSLNWSELEVWLDQLP
ncbi:MAG: dienelactone hydrolase family protein [Pseudomonadales bacterium]|nr:dienelactone hydrolase family protein [Pseudomonadales bacterium]